MAGLPHRRAGHLLAQLLGRGTRHRPAALVPGPLADNVTEGTQPLLVLILRGRLLRRYPDADIYAVVAGTDSRRARAGRRHQDHPADLPGLRRARHHPGRLPADLRPGGGHRRPVRVTGSWSPSIPASPDSGSPTPTRPVTHPPLPTLGRAVVGRPGSGGRRRHLCAGGRAAYGAAGTTRQLGRLGRRHGRDHLSARRPGGDPGPRPVGGHGVAPRPAARARRSSELSASGRNYDRASRRRRFRSPGCGELGRPSARSQRPGRAPVRSARGAGSSRRPGTRPRRRRSRVDGRPRLDPQSHPADRTGRPVRRARRSVPLVLLPVRLGDALRRPGHRRPARADLPGRHPHRRPRRRADRSRDRARAPALWAAPVDLLADGEAPPAAPRRPTAPTVDPLGGRRSSRWWVAPGGLGRPRDASRQHAGASHRPTFARPSRAGCPTAGWSGPTSAAPSSGRPGLPRSVSISTSHRTRRPSRTRAPPTPTPTDRQRRTAPVDPEMRWLIDYATAVAAGMAVDVALPAGTAAVDRVVAVGVRASTTATDSAAELASPADRSPLHRRAGVPRRRQPDVEQPRWAGRRATVTWTPTCCGSTSSALRPATAPPPPPWPQRSACPRGSSTARPAPPTPAIERAEAMQTATWAATWGYYLGQLLDTSVLGAAAGRRRAQPLPRFRPGPGHAADAAGRSPALRRAPDPAAGPLGGRWGQPDGRRPGPAAEPECDRLAVRRRRAGHRKRGPWIRRRVHTGR